MAQIDPARMVQFASVRVPYFGRFLHVLFAIRPELDTREPYSKTLKEQNNNELQLLAYLRYPLSPPFRYY